MGPVRPLDLAVTVQDSCHARVLEPDFCELPRGLLAALGVVAFSFTSHARSGWAIVCPSRMLDRVSITAL